MQIVVHADGVFSASGPKLAHAALRYRSDEVVAVIDSRHTGKRSRDITGAGSDADVPVVGSVAEALAYAPDTLLVGISLLRSSIPEALRRDVLAALDVGLNVISGLHYALRADPDVAAAAARRGVELVDLRQPTQQHLEVRPSLRRGGDGWVTLTVGSDASVGKMTTSLALERAAQVRGLTAVVLATGQTGRFVAGRGFPSDHLVSDFVPTVACEEATRAAEEFDWVFVEGQGALNHPMYSNGALGLLHGVDPDVLVLCHRAGATAIAGRPHTRLPSLPELVAMNEHAASWGLSREPRVVAISLDTRSLDLKTARYELDRAAAESGLPVSDPLRFGAQPLLDAVSAARVAR